MDSRIVNRELRSSIRPLLKENGFSNFSSRTSWRFRDEKIDVVNFQSFNSYNASVLGCTTHSFSLNLGCFFEWIPDPPRKWVPSNSKGLLLPREYHCHFRRSLRKGLPQPEFPRRGVWFISDEGRELESVVHDARMTLHREAFAWFERFDAVSEVARTLRDDLQDMEGTWGFGNPGSPAQHLQLGFTMLKLGDRVGAQHHLQIVLEGSSYEDTKPEIEAVLQQLRGAA